MSREEVDITQLEPTGDQCNDNAKMWESGSRVAYAIWYPQMGGYNGRAIVFTNIGGESNRCFDVYVWHDGEWPFHDHEYPTHLHHCNPEQFIEFGTTVKSLQKVTHE